MLKAHSHDVHLMQTCALPQKIEKVLIIYTKTVYHSRMRIRSKFAASEWTFKNLGHEEGGDGGREEVLSEQVYKGEDHQVEDCEGELVAVKQQGVEGVTAIWREKIEASFIIR